MGLSGKIKKGGKRNKVHGKKSSMNKKGLMVKFLTTLILAIIIFAPACYLGARLFRTSTQAKDNYVDFVKELNNFMKDSDQGIGARKSILLIMDTATAVVYFPAGKKEVLVAVDARAPYTDYTIHLQKPSQCENDKNCLCLFRKSEFDTTWWKPGYDTVTVIPQRVICSNLGYQLEIETCNIGTSEAVNSYACTDGFMIERHLADKSSWLVSSYYDNPRRNLIFFVKMDGSLRIIGNQDEQEGGSQSEQEKEPQGTE